MAKKQNQWRLVMAEAIQDSDEVYWDGKWERCSFHSTPFVLGDGLPVRRPTNETYAGMFYLRMFGEIIAATDELWNAGDKIWIPIPEQCVGRAYKRTMMPVRYKVDIPPPPAAVNPEYEYLVLLSNHAYDPDAVHIFNTKEDAIACVKDNRGEGGYRSVCVYKGIGLKLHITEIITLEEPK